MLDIYRSIIVKISTNLQLLFLCLFSVGFVKGHSKSVRSLIVAANGTEIISVSNDCTLRRWLVGTGQCVQVYQGHTNTVACVALLPNGNIVSGSCDKSIKVWDRLRGECLHTLQGHTSYIWGITVCPNGDVVSASIDFSLRVWRVGNTPSAPYVCYQVLANAHAGGVYCVTTVPGTDDLISGGVEGNVKLWRRVNPTADYYCVHTFEGHSSFVQSDGQFKHCQWIG